MTERILTDELLEMSRDRRSFIKKFAAGAAGLATAPLMIPVKGHAVQSKPGISTISFVTGNDRRDMIYRALNPLKDSIEKAIQKKQVIIKANLVGPDKLCAAHADAVRGVLDFLKPIYKKRVIIGDSTGRTYHGPMGTRKHFEIHGYLDLPKEYKVKLVDFNDMPTKVLWIFDKNARPLGVNIIETFLDPGNYIISLTRLKTHNGVVATLSVKNIVMGSPISHYKQKKVEGRNEKSLMHSGGGEESQLQYFSRCTQSPPPIVDYRWPSRHGRERPNGRNCCRTRSSAGRYRHDRSRPSVYGADGYRFQ